MAITASRGGSASVPPTDRLASPDIGLDHLMDLAQNFFSKTRWKRTFNLIRGYPTGS